MMPVPPTLVRRLVIAPLVIVVEVALIVVSPVLVLVAAIASPLTGGAWRPVRLVAIVVAWAALHLAAMLACLALWVASGFGLRSDTARNRRAHDALLRWFVDGITRSVIRWMRVTVVVEESAAAERALSDHRRPVVVLSRHAGEGDSLLVLHALLCRHARRPRVVLSEALRLDPLLDVLGRRLSFRFIDPRGGDTEVEIAAMARELDDDGAVLIFPEGGNFSAARRVRGIERLEAAGHLEEAAEARAMEHLSAPRPGGALAAIDALPRADVVFVGHAGMPEGLRSIWRLILDRADRAAAAVGRAARRGARGRRRADRLAVWLVAHDRPLGRRRRGRSSTRRATTATVPPRRASPNSASSSTATGTSGSASTVTIASRLRMEALCLSAWYSHDGTRVKRLTNDTHRPNGLCSASTCREAHRLEAVGAQQGIEALRP